MRGHQGWEAGGVQSQEKEGEGTVWVLRVAWVLEGYVGAGGSRGCWRVTWVLEGHVGTGGLRGYWRVGGHLCVHKGRGTVILCA